MLAALRTQVSVLGRRVKSYDAGKALFDAEVAVAEVAATDSGSQATQGGRGATAVIERLNANYSRLLLSVDSRRAARLSNNVADVYKARIYAELWNRLRFEVPTSFFLKYKTRNFHFDTAVSFFDRRSGRFLAGLESEVEAFLHSQGLNAVDFVDRSGLCDPLHRASLSSFRSPADWIAEERQREHAAPTAQPLEEQQQQYAATAASVDTETAPKKSRGRPRKVVADVDSASAPPAAAAMVTPGSDEAKPLRDMLRDHQRRLVEAALREPRSLLKCATGGGKTLVMATLCHVFDQARIIILCRNKNLVVQTADVLGLHLGRSAVGRVSGDYCESGARVLVSTIQSVNKISGLIASFDVLIADEVHQFGSKLSRQTLELFTNTAYRWGLSATPLKHGHEIHNYRLKGLFGPVACDVTTQELTSTSLLSSAAVRFVVISKPAKMTTAAWEVAERKGIYENEHMHRVVAHIVNQQIASGRVLILVHRLDHGDRLQAVIPGSFWISGSCSKLDRQAAFDRLKVSKPDEKVVVIVSSIGNTGIDVLPHYLINCSGGGVAEALTIQKIGRGLRTGADKKLLHYVDFMHETNPYLKRHSEIRLKTLWQEGHKNITVDKETEKIIDFEEKQAQRLVEAANMSS